VSLAALTSAAATPSPLTAEEVPILKVRLGTEGALPPWNFLDAAGNVTGFDIDVGNELCARAGLDCEWIVNNSDTMIPDLKARKFDAIVSAMDRTPALANTQ
jgi:polar amino acid transport system substrate-binding protein